MHLTIIFTVSVGEEICTCATQLGDDEIKESPIALSCTMNGCFSAQSNKDDSHINVEGERLIFSANQQRCTRNPRKGKGTSKVDVK